MVNTFPDVVTISDCHFWILVPPYSLVSIDFCHLEVSEVEKVCKTHDSESQGKEEAAAIICKTKYLTTEWVILLATFRNSLANALAKPP